ncbi:hypothetical protein ASPZODRAFT_96379 [Penicilliopsis zonata CBS 506.65]|uniref:Zn(2)-C6 fungal-type domain-containing protein n=1 Tax=Penicilliopsis zonata CBS 506.65 TaxID=1073090 RepID=A0A1L9SJN8_9EURO|nr:hypothetical protein ASPZODRAFT_96379 [Penicilliopsis zonata CBS 506.65]OJJ47377.1 hypothetical protein ASPZODRAFT_96379 [Penicilliopsis zonata CBS 506.65]
MEPKKEERKRAIRACDRCRKVKEKCEGGLPCRRCSYYRHVCEFSAAEDKARARRTRISKAYVAELTRRTLYMERILSKKWPGISLETESLRVTAESLDEGGERGCLDTVVGDSLDEDEDEGELSLEEECTLDPVQDNVTRDYSGEFSYWNFSMRVKRHLDDRMSSTMQPTQVSGYWRAEQLRSGLSNLSAAISCCPPRHIADFLVSIFFKHAQTSYFLVDETWFRARMELLYTDAAQLNPRDASSIAVILAVLAIGTQYAYLDSPQRTVRMKSGLAFSEDELGTMFYQQAIKLLPEIIELSSLESVQACLLVGVYTLPLDASGLSYIYLNLALRLAVQNGMHRRYTGTELSNTIIETRNRVWWSTYALERKINILHGRPLSILRRDVDADTPANIPELNQCVGQMNTSIQLVHYLEAFLNEMTSLRTKQIKNILSNITSTKESLTSWWASLPSTQLSPDRSTMHLQLEYCLVRLFIGRPFLLTRHTAEMDSPPAPASSPSSSSAKRPSQRNALIQDCIDAALEALDICHSLRDGPGLARASYVEYSACRASLLVLIAYAIQTGSDAYRACLSRGMGMICEMSCAGDSARSEVSLIESLEGALSRLHHAEGAGEGESKNTYDSFKHWERVWTEESSRPAEELNLARVFDSDLSFLNFPDGDFLSV